MSKEVDYIYQDENGQIEACYEFPWEIFKKIFNQTNTEFFDKAFVTFDLSKEEAIEFLRTIDADISQYIWVETCIFELTNYQDYLNKLSQYKLVED